MKKIKMTITPRALLARLNRRLAKDGRQIIGKAGQLNSYALVDEAKGEVIDPADMCCSAIAFGVTVGCVEKRPVARYRHAAAITS